MRLVRVVRCRTCTRDRRAGVRVRSEGLGGLPVARRRSFGLCGPCRLRGPKHRPRSVCAVRVAEPVGMHD